MPAWNAAASPEGPPERPSERPARAPSCTEDVNEAPAQVEGEPAEMERETPAQDNPSIERVEPHAPPPAPLFEE